MVPIARKTQESAGHHLHARVPRASPETTAGELLRSLQGRDFDATELICVCDPDGRLLGGLPLGRVISLPAERRLGEAMQQPIAAVRPDEDQERIASIALHHRLEAVPVVDANGFLLGIVPPAALLSILRREHVEDIHRLAGIYRETAQARHALHAPPVRRARDRLPWLLVGLVGSIIATAVMSRFEQALQSQLAIAFFVPGLVYLADAIGTQTEAIAVRGLSLSHSPLAGLLGSELRTGVLIGGVLGSLVFVLVWLGFGEARLALAVALAVLFAGAAATTIGLALPWALAHIGSDPALGGGPLATVIQDVLSLLIYFAVVTLLL
ncbi:MAG: magnesium transporter [Burkholderiales bacterium]|nr:magnesium transporter [Burkholderiales bacterium]